MSSSGRNKQIGREHLLRIINLCNSVEGLEIDPFTVDVEKIIQIINQYFPTWKNTEELCLDVEALHKLASTINLQNEWVKHRSSSLYKDPLLIEKKLLAMSSEEISSIFMSCWHPLVELEQISPRTLKEANKYWQSLAPLHERWQSHSTPFDKIDTSTLEELINQQIVSDKGFSLELEAFWQKLKEIRAQMPDGEKLEYWDFVGAETYEETVRRAYLTSFLVTYGFATLEIDRLEEKIFIKPCKTQMSNISKKQAVSIPIMINFEGWKEWKEQGQH